MRKSLSLLALCLLASGIAALHKGRFHSDVWSFDHENVVGPSSTVKFVVALKLSNVEEMRKHFLEVSNPKSNYYGQHLSLTEVNERYGPPEGDKQRVIEYFQSIDGAEVRHGRYSDMISVTAPVSAVEGTLKTKLSYVKDSRNLTGKKTLRMSEGMEIPSDIEDHIAFVSLNSPVNRISPRGAGAQKQRQAVDNAKLSDAELASSVGITAGNEEALIRFTPYCSAGVINTMSPPCSDLPLDDVPVFTFSVTEHANNKTGSFPLNTDPTDFVVKNTGVYCYNTFSSATCSGNDGNNCTCLVKLSPLPKYTQLRVNITSASVNSPSPSVVGTSNLFALTDVATAAMLSKLYNIPAGLSVKHGSNQSVAEFYHEFYSNSDLSKFLALSGLPPAELPVSNVYGDLPNDESDPGGEAQLDVEYIMAIAPGAETYFYSFSDYNPNDPVNATSRNEGFLEYLMYVQNQTYPPLVHSMSYGDLEADIFNASHNGSVAYGNRCDEEFMKMGLRGLTIVFSSGDDGIGSSMIRDDKETACSQAWPEWPASSPYVTTVGATQLTNKYLPVCGTAYSVSGAYPGLPEYQQLLVECTGTGETVCTGAFGGVITSGGGFADYNNRSETAPWQEDAVNAYLTAANAAAYPALSYFNPSGRGYPDVTAYGSNYLVYLNGKTTRESGTSASAPVFSAMVTLWNDMRLAYGMPPMGFIAPFLYQAYATSPDAFNDIVTGNNACGVGSSIETAPCCTYSYAATPGWDASSGLGSPNFGVLANLVLNNDTYFPATSAYPNGAKAQTVYVDDGSDDEVSEQATIGLALGATALAVAVVALLAVVYMCVRGGGGRGNGGDGMATPFAK